MGARDTTPSPRSTSKAAREALESLSKNPKETGICADFDGTLAEITADPASAVPLPGVLATLDRLVRSFGVVVVVSGRPGAFLSERLEVANRAPGLCVYGLYGSEYVTQTGEVIAREAPSGWSRALEEAASALERSAPTGCTVEIKGTSVALHWRNAPAEAARAHELARACANKFGLSLLRARKAVELVPPGTPNKGDVVEALLDKCSTTCVLGDDEGDLAAFEALDRLASKHPIVAVRIAINSNEAPEALIASADLVLDCPREAISFLSRLASVHSAES